MRKILCTLFSLLLFIFSLHSQSVDDSTTKENLMDLSFEELLSLDVTISIASSKGDKIFKSPSTISIIDKNTIQQYNFRSITEALMTVSGFTISRTYLKRNIPTARGIMQDHYANKVLIMINGVPSWNAVTGEGSLERIDINDVERIEVLKGPASVLYGTNAYSGTVNIVLKSTEHKQGGVYGEYGSGLAYRAGGNVMINNNKMKLFISANTSDETGSSKEFLDETNTLGYINEYMDISNLTLNLKIASHTFSFNTFKVSESYLGVAPGFSSGAGNPHNSNGILGNYDFNKDLGKRFNLNIGSTFDYGARNLSRIQSDDIRASIEGYRVNGYVKTGVEITDKIDFEIGGNYEYRYSKEYKNYNIHTDSLSQKSWSAVDTVLPGTNGMDDIGLGEGSAFAQLKAEFWKITALGGIRYTNNANFGQDLSSRATVVFGLNEMNSFKIIYGESFRSPSFFESNFFYTTVLGNEELEPEKCRSFELSYLTSFNKFFLQVLGYYSMYDNKIYRQEQEVVINDSVISINKYENGDQFTATGVEVELKYANPKLVSGFVNYSFVYGDNGDEADSTGHYNFKYVPQHTLSAGLSKTIKGFGFSVLSNFSSACEGPFYEVPSWLTFDASISYKKEFDAFTLINTLTCKNITDEDIRIPEFTRRKVLNDVSSGSGRYIGYSFKVLF